MISNTGHNDAFLFYSCAISSFLESRANTYVDNLEPFFLSDAGTLDWLKTVWLPEETEHGSVMREYVETTWPDFDWESGFFEFSRYYVPQCDTAKLRPSISLEALSRCVTETQATMIYRCLGRYTKDEGLRALFRRMSTDEVRHYRVFKNIHKQHEQPDKTGYLDKVRMLLRRNLLVREEDLALAFQPLNTSWKRPPGFNRWTYSEYLSAAAQVMQEHFPFEEAKRMLFSPIKGNSLFGKIAVALLARLLSWQFLRYASMKA